MNVMGLSVYPVLLGTTTNTKKMMFQLFVLVSGRLEVGFQAVGILFVVILQHPDVSVSLYAILLISEEESKQTEQKLELCPKRSHFYHFWLVGAMVGNNAGRWYYNRCQL